LILFTGGGTSGSWKVRGEQLGAACGALVKPKAEDCSKASVIVAVKRIPPALLTAIRASRKPWVWDIVDAYPQPTCSMWNKAQAVGWVRGQIQALAPTAMIWPNQRMREDCDTGLPGVVIPHHYRPNSDINLIREKVLTVGYEGSTPYINDWIAPITQACADRGWSFVINPASLSEVDIVVAFRTTNYVQRHWKSNVKLANAHGTGTPFIGQRECGYLETQTGLEQWAECPDDLDDCFDMLSGQYHRQTVSKAFLAKRYSADDAARDMRVFLSEWH
jgi:hypothetical protein